MTRRRTRRGLTREVPGAPQAGWRVNLMSPSEKLARRHVDYPSDGVDKGRAEEFIGVAYLLPTSQEINAVPALGCSMQDERALFNAVISSRNAGDLTNAWDSEFDHPRLGKLQATQFGRKWNVVRCGVEGCSKHRQWHNASADFVITDEHVAEASKGEGYTVQIVLRGGEWALQVHLNYATNGKALTARQAADLTNDIAWLNSEIATLNARTAVAA